MLHRYALKTKAKALPGLCETAPSLVNAFTKIKYETATDPAADESSSSSSSEEKNSSHTSKTPMKRGLPKIAVIRATGPALAWFVVLNTTTNHDNDTSQNQTKCDTCAPLYTCVRPGAISGRVGSPSPFSMSEGIKSEVLIKEVRRAKADPSVVAVVLRVDSPGLSPAPG